MTPVDVRTMPASAIVELLVDLRPSDEVVAWLASVLSDPVKVAGVNELSRRYTADCAGKCSLPRARAAGTIRIDGARFKHLMWVNRIPMNQIGPMIGKCAGWGSAIAHKCQMSYWAADEIATELGMHVDAFIEAIATSEELQRLSA